MASRQDFELAFQLLIGHEAGFTLNPEDNGNWTGGRKGAGELKGTKYGISAHAYPNLDIRHIDLSTAHNLYESDYWLKSGCDQLSPRTAYIVFDAAVNMGVHRAVTFLQQAVGTAVDGRFGPNTRAAVAAAVARDESHLLVEFHAHRLRFMVSLNTWPTFRGGWSRRLVSVALEAADYWPSPTVGNRTGA